MHILAEISPLDPVTGTRPTLRVSSAQDRTLNGLNGAKWWPGLLRKPTLGLSLFDGDFSSGVIQGKPLSTSRSLRWKSWTAMPAALFGLAQL